MSASHSIQKSTMEKTYKLVLLGGSGTGKTKLIDRYVKDKYDDDEVPTVGAGFYIKNITCNEQLIKLNIWDTSGNDRYQALTKIYCQDAQIFLICVNLSNASIFDSINNYLSLLAQEIKSVIGIVVNKDDDEANEVISKEAFESYCKDKQLHFFYTSAKTNKKVIETFSKAAELFLLKEAELAEQKKEEKLHKLPSLQPFSNYLSFFKVRIFGYHHRNRAKAIKKVLEEENSIKTKLDIINNQIALFKGEKPKALELENLDNEWTTRLTNKPNDKINPEGEYYKELIRLQTELTSIQSKTNSNKF